MTIKEPVLISHLDDEPWLNQNKASILKSIRTYSQPVVDRLSDLYQFQTYIITHRLCSDSQLRNILLSAKLLSRTSFRHLCSILSEPDIELLYDLIRDGHYEFFYDMWMICSETLIKTSKRRMELLVYSYDFAGRKGMTNLMKHIIVKYPFMLNTWVGFDTSKVVRFYSDIGKLVFFDDESIDVLVNSLEDKELVNQTKLREMLKSILARKNCSALKRAEILFSI